MEDRNIRVLPVLNADQSCEGLISLFKMSKFFFPTPNRPFDSRKVRASLMNLACTLNAEMVFAVDSDREEELIMMVGAMSLESFSERLRGYPREKLMVVVGDRRDIQALAIQPHPEWMGDNDRFVQYCRELTMKYILGADDASV